MNITIEIPTQRISDLLISALEGGSNHWYLIEEYREPARFTFENDGGERFKKENKHWHQDYPLNRGGYMKISNQLAIQNGDDTELKSKVVDLSSLKIGLEIMAKKYPDYFGTFLREDDDAETADVFLQCTVFGKVIYG